MLGVRRGAPVSLSCDESVITRMEVGGHASTFGEKQVGGSILLVVREVLDDTFDILRCWHEYVHCLKLWLGFPNARNRFDYWLTRS